MTIYNFNLGIGWASSGVEYAQAYRSKIFKKNNQRAKFIFTDLFHENLEPMTRNIGFDDDEIIWLYQFFTDTKISPTSFTLQEVEARFSSKVIQKDVTKERVHYTFSNDISLTAYLDERQNSKVVYKTEFFEQDILIQRDYYTYIKIFSEYFKPVDREAYLYQRRFFNEDGSLAYEELLSGKESMYIFRDRTIYSKENLIRYFMKNLNLTSSDILIIDRATGIGAEILRGKGEAKVGVVVHAEHFNESLSDGQRILWNNYYDYQFENAQYIDFFITATDLQKQILEQQFADYKKGRIRVFSIPVGSIDELKKGYKRQKNVLITASRLAEEKHLDWLVRAVVQARKVIKDLGLDIYGCGGEEETLRSLIEELGAQNYINLMGHQDLDDIYRHYTTYISTSTSEGFGLTLLEAVGSGLGLIGFDVRYGNQNFIDEGKNGFLVDYIKNDTNKNIERIAQAIVKLQSQSSYALEKVEAHSYKIAEEYQTSCIQKSWLNLEKELIND